MGDREFCDLGYLLCPRCGGNITGHITARYEVEIEKADVENNGIIMFADGLYKTTIFYYCKGCGKKWNSLSAIMKNWSKKGA